MVSTILIILILAYSVILHEIAHGAVAYALGDPTAKERKRLTLNPLRHIDPIGTVVLPAILVIAQSPALLGWAKPVPFDPRYFKNRRAGIALVSLAGPATNFLLAIVAAGVFRLAPDNSTQATVAFYAVVMNVILGIFNLIPIPPMDGSKMVGVFLPDGLRRAYFSLDRIGFFLVFTLLYFGLGSRFLSPLYTALVRLLTQVQA